MSTEPNNTILRLGVNIDHVATIRNARGGLHPDPVRAAQLAVDAGADGITAHLREDRRHISDRDISRLKADLTRPLNLEMAATEEMKQIALRHLPNATCLVPERREELTTEGGLDVKGQAATLNGFVTELRDAGIRVSLFIDPDADHVAAAREIGADIVELHTGSYCQAHESARPNAGANSDDGAVPGELARLRSAAEFAHSLGLEVHAGHGLTFDSVGAVAAIPQLVELNIGHFLIGEAIFGGLHATVTRMRTLMVRARAEAGGALSA